jgi:2-keto-4-pentenoate hydratase
MTATDTVADRLIRSYLGRTPIVATPDAGPDGGDAAYAVQRAVWRAMVGAARPTAWKVGTPAVTVEPVAAPVFPSRLAVGPASLSGDLFLSLGVEAEIALRFGKRLPRRVAGCTRAEILDAIGSVHVAMELVDTRLADAEAAGPHWRLADNLLNGALVLGDAIPHWRELDWNGQGAQVWLDGTATGEAGGRPPLGDIFHCLPWWLVHAGGAEPGDIVTTGAWSGMHPAGQATDLAVTFAGLGRAQVRVGPRRKPRSE